MRVASPDVTACGSAFWIRQQGRSFTANSALRAAPTTRVSREVREAQLIYVSRWALGRAAVGLLLNGIGCLLLWQNPSGMRLAWIVLTVGPLAVAAAIFSHLEHYLGRFGSGVSLLCISFGAFLVMARKEARLLAADKTAETEIHASFFQLTILAVGLLLAGLGPIGLSISPELLCRRRGPCRAHRGSAIGVGEAPSRHRPNCQRL